MTHWRWLKKWGHPSCITCCSHAPPAAASPAERTASHSCGTAWTRSEDTQTTGATSRQALWTASGWDWKPHHARFFTYTSNNSALKQCKEWAILHHPPYINVLQLRSKKYREEKKKLKVNMSQLKIYSIYRLQMPVLKSSLEQSDPQPQWNLMLQEHKGGKIKILLLDMTCIGLVPIV